VNLLGIDVGSSSVKAAVLKDGEPRGRIVRAFFETDHRGVRVEVPAERVLKAVAAAVGELGRAAKSVDAIGLSVMSPAWCAMDARGRALTPLVTHQDRRSVALAAEIERRVGKARHLAIAGNRPFPGGISSTTWAWYLQNEPARLAKADLVGQLNTYLHRHLTGARVIDPSNASFTGLYATCDQSGWSDELCDAIGASRTLLPHVLEADVVAGRVTPSAAGRFGLADGTPVMAGLIDTSAAMLLAGARPGQLLDVCGSTDVLALCTDRPRPHERLLTRALGVRGAGGGRRWMSVSTIAAAGSSLLWARQQLFPDLTPARFRALVHRLARRRGRDVGGVGFEPYLAGERTSVEQRRAAFTGLTLSTTREQMLAAMIESLARASAERLALLADEGGRIRRSVGVSGGAEDRLDAVFQRDWPGRWRFRRETEASLRGIGRMRPRLR
jgi:xylulokinase